METLKKYWSGLVTLLLGLIGVLWFFNKRKDQVTSDVLDKNKEIEIKVLTNDLKIDTIKKELDKEELMREEIKQKLERDGKKDENLESLNDFFNNRNKS